MGISEIIDQMKEEIRQEIKVIETMEKRIAELPPGALCVSKIKNDKYYYQKVSAKGKDVSIYLDHSLDYYLKVIWELMEKKTIVHGLPVLRKNISAMQKCLDKVVVYHPANYKYGRYLGKEYYLKDDICIEEWSKKPDSQNGAFRENLIHKTKSEKMVRSKSEVLIADSLYDEGLEFKCEAELRLAKRVVYPDFEILHPKTHKLIWWEHLGMLDDSRYVVDNLRKIIDYCREGIVPGKNLIITYETKEQPLTHEMINQRLIEYGLK